MSAPTDQHEHPPLIIGTAGHIDHGKSALVRALTGTDPDRLKEEKQRGITIELGYAFLSERIAFIDVPGHEKFIRQMVAGAATVDAALLVIAADDGVMPQTREHFDILNLLGVSRGLVALTKADLVDPDWLALVREDINRLLEKTPLAAAEIHVVDSLSGRGIEALKSAIFDLAARHQPPPPGRTFRLPVDRVFTIKGFGTVVTGSTIAGTVKKGDELELLPAGRKLRVKGVQSQGRVAEEARAGQRTALNLHGVAVADVARGDVLATPGMLAPSTRVDLDLHLLKSAPGPLKHRQRVRFHSGCAELFGRVILLDDDLLLPGGRAPAQIQLEAPAALSFGDRFVIRRYSPELTIGGGRVLDPAPRKHKRKQPETLAILNDLASDDPARQLEATIAIRPLVARADLANLLGHDARTLDRALAAPLEAGSLIEGAAGLITQGAFSSFKSRLVAALMRQHATRPLQPGIKKSELIQSLKGPWAHALTEALLGLAQARGIVKTVAGDCVALPEFSVTLNQNMTEDLARIERELAARGARPPSTRELADALGLTPEGLAPILSFMSDNGQIRILDGELVLGEDVFGELTRKLADLFAAKPAATLSDIRQHLDTTRKYVVPLMELTDALGLTRRSGDTREAGPKLASRLQQEGETQ